MAQPILNHIFQISLAFFEKEEELKIVFLKALGYDNIHVNVIRNFCNELKTPLMNNLTYH